MKTRYIPALFLSLTLFGATAQTDNKKSLQRAVTIEKEFTPIVQDASKINSIPEMEVSASERPDIKYTEYTDGSPAVRIFLYKNMQARLSLTGSLYPLSI